MKKKPKFKRQNFLLKKLKNAWRKPKGIHSKLRLKKRGKGKRPKIGYGNNKNLRGLIKNQEYVYIKNIKDLENIKKPMIISSNIGLKKKLEIVKKSGELGLKIININADKFLDDIKNKAKKKKKAEEKSEEDKNKAKKIEKKETKEEKEEKLKGEKRKVLEKGM